jgi:hypothetical protein
MKSSIFRWVLSLILLPILAASHITHPAYAHDQVISSDPAGRNTTLLAAGVTLNCALTQRSSAPGSLITYALTLTNTGDAADTFSLDTSSNLWPTAISLTAVTLEPGAATTINVAVTIPTNASAGDSYTLTVKAVSGLDASITGSVTLVTQVDVPTEPPPAGTSRPLIVVAEYNASNSPILVGTEFDLHINLKNKGQSPAYNLVLTFSGSDFIPRDTGGVRSISLLVEDKTAGFTQPLLADVSLYGKSIGTLTATISYADGNGNTYTETFTLSIDLKTPTYSSSSAKPTATATITPKSQIVVTSYTTDVDPLQPGTIFNLALDVRNLGSAEARSVILVLGGGATPSSSDGGTPQPGGVPGGSGDLQNFAPLESSNLYYLGNLPAGGGVRSTSKLIVNVTTNPGAYPLKLSFIYDDGKGNRLVDDQVVTLLVYSLPAVSVSFYQDPGRLISGQPNPIPLQVTNLGKKSAVLGNLTITSSGADVTNNISLVGALESGGYFTLDALAIPFQAGPLELQVTIEYTDDFNQGRKIEQTLTLQVDEMPVMETPPIEIGPDGKPVENFPVDTGSETFWQKVWRFIKGLLGLGSGQPLPPMPGPGEELPPDQQPIIIPGGKG